VNVKAGYARYLIRTGIAVLATEERIKETEARRSVLELEDKKIQAQALMDAETLNKSLISFVCAAGGQGRLYGSVGVGDIATGIKSELGIDVPKNAILTPALHVTGVHQVPIHLTGNARATLRVLIAESEEARAKLLKQSANQESKSEKAQSS
jgi:large subunit ribosomal protein L9